MKIPVLHGVIKRRILVNYAIDPQVAQALLPEPFRPLLHNGNAIGGVCLIGLENIKPKALPFLPGISSENAAHRFAVQWDVNGQTMQGVYIPRRDTSSRLNALAGGRIFPGEHHLADFEVSEQLNNYTVGYKCPDGHQFVVEASQSEAFESDSVFSSLDTASTFLQQGCLGYTPSKNRYDGVKLNTYNWQVHPLEVTNLTSSYFDNKNIFPEGSIKFDNALLMKNVEHEWQVQDKLLP